MPGTLADDLKRDIAEGRVACIVGAGVSMAATFDKDRRPNVASWIGLLHSGVDECVKVAQPLSKGWEERVRGEIDSGDLEELLSAAEKISRKLSAPTGGAYGKWLRETVGSLRIRHREVPLALRDLGVPLLTTNYDGVLEEATGSPALTWRDGAQVERVLRGEDRSVVHLHGHWARPDSVILGIRSYEEVLRDPHAQAMLHALRAMKTLLFVGFGAGLDDPNFGALLAWSREALATSQYQHYRLCREAELEGIRAQHKADERILVVSYGKEFGDLGPFLRSLVPRAETAPPPPRSPSIPPGTPRPTYADAMTQALSEQIEAARRRREALKARGFDVSEINDEISNLRRKLREGGHIKAGDSLDDGRYLLLNQVGRGGFAAVWRAHDRDSGEIVAIKILHDHLARDAIRRDRFARGARTMATLEHDAIVRLLRPHGEDSGVHYFVMEFMVRGDMDKLVSERHPSMVEVVAIILRIGSALAHAHARGLVHRDVKPANILFNAAGEAKLTDFDLVTAHKDSTGGTGTGPMGTPHYAAPELRTHPEDADHRADIYSLGMTAIFGLLSRVIPNVQDPTSVVDELLCSNTLKSVLKRAIAWTAGGRFASVDEFCEVLSAVSAPRSTDLPPSKSLRGQDLSRKDFQGADLVGADLVGARLVGANFRGANLRYAQLIGADLSNAFLSGADLFYADLSSARLLGAELGGARLEGVLFREAKLVGARVDAGALQDCEMFGAAPPDPKHIAPMVGLSSPCGALAWSPDGAYLISGHKDGSVRIWAVRTMEARRILRGHKGAVRSVAFHHKGMMVAAGSADGTIRLWDVADGRELRVYSGHSAPVTSVAWSPDGSTLASASEDKTVRLWDGTTRHRILSSRRTSAFESVAISPDGTIVAGACRDSTIRLWKLISGEEIRVLAGHRASVRSIGFSPDGALLASGSDDKTIRLWSVSDGAVRWSIDAHSSPVWSLAFCPDGRSLATGSSDRTVRIWDVQDGKSRLTLGGYGGPVGAVSWSRDGKTLATGSDDKTIRLFAMPTQTEERLPTGHDGALVSVAFSTDGEILATGASDGSVVLWNVTYVSQRRVLAGLGGQVVAFSPDKTTVAGGAEDGTIRLWNSVTGEERRALRGHGGLILGLAWSADGATLASGSKDTTIRLWDAKTGEERRVFEIPESAIWSVAFDMKRLLVASGSKDTTIRLWDIMTGEERRVLEVREGPVYSLAFSPDGVMVAAGARDGTVHVWDVATARTLHVLSGHERPVVSVAWSPDGATLASGSEDTTMRLWDITTGQARQIREEHTAPVTSSAWSPDGGLLASASRDGTVRLWDAKKGHCLAVLLPLPNGWVFFTPDGRYRLNGETAGAFWHTIGLCRFQPEELEYLNTPLLISYKMPWLIK